jgi:hypothetical protein
VLALVLVTLDVLRPLALGLLGTQVAVFAFTAFVSFHWSVWAQLFARFVWPRLKAPAALKDARPPRLAQFVGFVLTAAALMSVVLGADALGLGLTAATLGMAALDAATGFCLGCTLYPLVRRP